MGEGESKQVKVSALIDNQTLVFSLAIPLKCPGNSLNRKGDFFA